MTPAARVAAAIAILDGIAAGAPAEKALTGWARANRFAGSGDRAAIRDHVFDALRRWRSAAYRGGAGTGRGRMLGLILEAGADPDAVFTGERFAPAPLTTEERRAAGRTPPEGGGIALDWPDWLLDPLAPALGPRRDAVLAAMRHRAFPHLRVNLRRADAEATLVRLAAEGVEAAPHPLSPTALTVERGARQVSRTGAFRDGWVELQDAASQAAADLLPLPERGGRILDYCAGGGGKALALAARAPGARVAAHDADPRRMRDLPARAARAGTPIAVLDGAGLSREAPFDAVFVDAPCSGSGSWQRDPHGKWRLDPRRLSELTVLQRQILTRAARHVAPGGTMVYATCSLLPAENEAIVAAFLAEDPGWRRGGGLATTALDGANGFFAARLHRGGRTTEG